ncbi:hypothetical protein EAG_14752 [Camponotus floridanus]|uniref:Uncharacterized protein n=1 Tax=Camponotus floridanus TaxID=104421 RepID=E2A566_CAMFO|nr:hypothetical protein EAG_14752 [Camponotus floridanus]
MTIGLRELAIVKGMIRPQSYRFKNKTISITHSLKDKVDSLAHTNEQKMPWTRVARVMYSDVNHTFLRPEKQNALLKYLIQCRGIYGGYAFSVARASIQYFWPALSANADFRQRRIKEERSSIPRLRNGEDFLYKKMHCHNQFFKTLNFLTNKYADLKDDNILFLVSDKSSVAKVSTLFAPNSSISANSWLIIECFAVFLHPRNGGLLSAFTVIVDREKYARLNGILGENCSKNSGVVYIPAANNTKITVSNQLSVKEIHSLSSLSPVIYGHAALRVKNSGRFNQYVYWKMDEPEFL